MSFLRGRQGFSLTIILACALVVIVIGYLLTGWNPDNFKGDKLTLMMGILSFIGIILLVVIPYGFRARVERSHIKSDNEIDLRVHTVNFCKEIYEPLLDIIVGTNPNAQYEIQFKVHPLDQDGNPTQTNSC
jgi:Na+/melibiose symporter-like transporter